MKPILGITMGDAAGIGPEIIAKALMDREIYTIARPVVIGDKKVMERAVEIAGAGLQCRAVDGPEAAGSEYGVIDIIDLSNLPADLPWGTIDARAGKAAYEYIEKAINYALKKEIHAVVTAPLNKEALNLGGHHFPGHTEILAQLGGVKNYAMMLVGGSLRVIHATTHVSLRNACDLIKKERVLRVIELADQALKLLGIDRPRIAVAGLNPHSGEGGLFGREDMEEIAPAVELVRQKGIHAIGPIAPDTVFYRTAIKKQFDIVVVMYHDQGHIPIKLLGFENGVNVTVGLPFIRTSVDHGTAFDIAGKGIADSRSMTESLRLGAQMACQKSF
ncbi:4-hydroxythreonine-4-phosphate dehydrogenase pdxa [Lucifera butyrica]|uniref:4-hydroxythreonine-4-phosphate dehydrogenase pdxa n=1 Tax=Lucifera butyrica TaxID=1351585 RepID=A0A498R4R7_9FIRM|nr:4-hydroxythreonine-4-phosphate dehydrogenase PdxA [Lucifera butyrica]VBB07686.1 4-hydroxythreonine-4-phosphate dehydrogenase pdxa [Lucifera butyrica]